ncbi:NF-kappa-B inhibitor epsilon-like [Glandiceps talaboti]
MSKLSSDVVEDCAFPARNGSEIDERDYYSFHPKFEDLKAPEYGLSTDSGFGSVGSSATKSLREEEYEKNACDITKGLQTMYISPETKTVSGHEFDEGEEVYADSDIKLSLEAFEQDDDGDNALHLSIIHNRQDVAEAIIDQAPSCEFLDIHNDLLQKPLHLAVILKQSRICRKLIVAGATVDARDRHGETPLHLACSGGDMNTVQAVIEPLTADETYLFKGMRVPQLPQDLELKNYEGFTCLHLAAFGNQLEVLEYLVSKGADINAGDGKSGRTALHYAVENGNANLIRFLLHYQAYVDTLTYNGCTPLHLAVGRGYQQGAEILMQAGADAALLNFEHESAHDLAGSNRTISTVLEPTYDDFKINGQPVSL